MSAVHNHLPRCCCASLDMGASYGPDDDYCPGCFIHGDLAIAVLRPIEDPIIDHPAWDDADRGYN